MHGTWEPVALMQREKLKRRTRKSRSTEAGHRDGPECSSDEASVMGVERRSPGHPAFKIGQPEMGGVSGKSEAICNTQTDSLGCV